MRVVVVPHNPQWAEMFHAESAAVANVLGTNLAAVHHIGSTAIPTIYAKPIIDLLVEVADLAELDARTSAMQSLGYEACGEFGIPGRRYFRKNDHTGTRTHQVHAFAAGSPQIERHLCFRDFLRVHPDEAQQYSDLKRKLAAAHPHDIQAYMDGKDAFIKQILKLAEIWTGSSPR